MTCRLPAQQARPILQKEVYTTKIRFIPLILSESVCKVWF